MRRAALVALVVLASLPHAANAQPFPERDLPPELRPWVAWVRDEVPNLGCPAVEGSAVCFWPGRLGLRLDAAGGTFAFEAHADRLLDARLPGDTQHWPQDVRLDGRPAAVVEREGGPAIRMAAGGHRVEGRFAWSHLPDSLAVPPQIGLVDLTVEGRAVPQPRRDEGGLVWLRAEGEAAGAAESLRLQAFRRIADGIPLWVETRLTLEVSGKARELELIGALLPGSVPVSVGGDLPARLDPSGRLRVQARAGSFSVAVLARLEGRPQSLARPPVTDPWPAREVWVFAADERLRQVELSGLAPVDPSRTDLPQEWTKLPAFVVEPASRLALKEVRRGEPEAAPDRIQLRRELWLDLSGRGFTVRDSFSGALSRTWRLDLQKPGDLGRAAVDRVDQLITADPSTGASGLELRRGALQFEADSRLPRTWRVPAVGWSADVEQLGATLNLPPGWSLLSAWGVDKAPSAWTGRFTLLGIFFVVIVTLAVLRLFGPRWAALTALAMVLSYEEPGAPFLVWLSLLGAIALVAVAPDGRLQRLARLWRTASVVVLVLILIPFVRDQVRGALYPQVAGELAPGFQLSDMLWSPLAARKAAPAARAPAPPPAAPAPQAAMNKEEADRLEALGYVQTEARAPAELSTPSVEGGVVGGVAEEQKAEVADQRQVQQAPALTYRLPAAKVLAKAGRVASMNLALEQDPRAVLQTGPGVPHWSWRSHRLSWSGPVKSDQSVRLWLVSPRMNQLLTFLRIVLVLLLAARLLVGQPSLRPGPGARGLGAAAAALALVMLAPAIARADDETDNGKGPSQALLEELKRRLTRPEPCQPNCISTSTMRVRLQDETLSFAAEVHAADVGAWAVPGPTGSWTPGVVRVDGQPTTALVRLGDGFLHVRLAAGVHQVEASGPAPRGDALTLQLRDRPRQASADAPGWDVAGLRGDGPPDASIQLSRRLRAGERARGESGQYAPWLEVRRILSIGLTWRIRTEIHRVSPTGAPVSLRVPLVAGEAPIEADLETKDGAAVVSFGRDQTDAGWSSTLPVTESLDLKAPEGQPWSEVWRLECSLVWQCQTDGLAPVSRQSSGLLAPEFRPWPGETLRVAFQHPQAVAGQTLTLDGLRLETTPGARLTTTVMTLTARASREEPLALTLPTDAEVQQVTVGGVERPSRPDQGRLQITVPAGTQAVVVRWREPLGMGLYHRVPAVTLPVPAVNAETVLHVPDDRWLLLTRGPAWGPAVLFWSYLLFALVVAFFLGVLAESPLGIGAWLLLALGLSQTSALAAALVAGWFLALAWRARRPPALEAAHNALQIALMLWLLAALAVLYGVIETGLLLRPDMQVAGGGSTNTALRWYADRIERATPNASVLSVPLWVYRGLMLAWALWLATSILSWSRWAWQALGEGGLWRRIPRPPKAAAGEGDQAATEAAPPAAKDGPPPTIGGPPSA